MSIEELSAVLAPPDSPMEIGDQAGWEELKGKLRIDVPADYKEFIGSYGTGSVDEFLWILSPFASNKNLNLVEQIQIRLDALRTLKEEYGEELPFEPYPRKGGIIPCAFTDNGDVVYWVTDGDPSEWTIAVNESRSPEWEEYHDSLTGFLTRLLTKRIKVIFFPDEFPSSTPSFRPL